MSQGITLAPCGLAVEGVETDAEKLVIVARAVSAFAVCPGCGTMSASVHSLWTTSRSPANSTPSRALAGR